MKTPIPEKIKPQYDKLGFPTGTWMTINSLIDVVTEQQREIEGLKSAFINHTIVDNSVAHKPYTAMRSTGEYCECTSTILNYHKDDSGWWVCDKCGKPSSERPYITKPQEDIEKFVDYSIKKYKKTYKALGNSQEDIRERLIEMVKDEQRITAISGTPITPGELADRILAIVKGE